MKSAPAIVRSPSCLAASTAKFGELEAMPTISQKSNAGRSAVVRELSSERWTVLHHHPDKDSAKGTIPESWLCVDCGIDTAPGMPKRKEVERDFFVKGSSSCCYSEVTEVYTVTAELWKRTGLGPMDGCLCIACLEQRIGRRLRPKDFTEHVFNEMPASKRLRKRRGRR
jgi:hypothetical protein